VESEKIGGELMLVLALPDPIEAIQKLETARFEYECLLDYCLENHRDSVPTEFVQDSLEEIQHLADRYGV